jgi:hypothetical protein
VGSTSDWVGVGGRFDLDGVLSNACSSFLVGTRTRARDGGESLIRSKGGGSPPYSDIFYND